MSRKDKRTSRGGFESSPVAQLFATALARHQAGQLAEAQQLYSQALALDRKHAPSLHYLGVLAYQRGRHQEAIDLIGRAIALDGTDAESHYNVTLPLLALGRADEAIVHCRRAIALKGDHARAHNNLGLALKAQGHIADAVAHFQQAVRHDPALTEAYINLGGALLRYGKLNDAMGVINHAFDTGVAEARAGEALDLVRQALAIEESVDTRTLFVQCVRNLRTVPNSEGVRDLMVRALTEPWGRPADLSAAAGALVTHDTSDPLLRALLTSAPIRDISLERFLTKKRAELLDVAVANKPCNEDDLAFACALARQCFINEYAFDVAPAELEKVQSLREGADASPLRLAAFAAYEPLHTLADAESLLDRSWPDAVNALIDLQVREPRAERRVGESLPRLTPIADAVSLQVREQYEQNPYPRWIKTAPIGRATTLDAYLGGKFKSFRALEKPAPEALIAGCGTGQHVATVALQFTGLRILAIDLSLASLAYAQRATHALGLAGIDYAQADILQLGAIGRTFDLIDSSGVLHHLADPFAGWRVLVSLLRPGGVMRLGLYSALGRRDVAAVRQFVAARGYRADAPGIRQCRQELMGFAVGTPQRAVAETSDFFSTSECRDLLFHVQEHNLTLPQIKDFLAANALTFLGFEGCARGYQRYAQLSPGDSTMADLDRWAAIENQDPRLFLNMYQFWVQKPR